MLRGASVISVHVYKYSLALGGDVGKSSPPWSPWSYRRPTFPNNAKNVTLENFMLLKFVLLGLKKMLD